MKLTDAELKDAQELCEKATPGPWKVIQGGQPVRLSKDDENIGDSEGMSIVTEDDLEVVGCSEWMRAEDVDFAFIAAARALLPRALAELREMRKPCVWRREWLGKAEAFYTEATCGFATSGKMPFCPGCGKSIEVKEEGK